MRLISKVEVAYFRSIYKDQIEDCSDTNVIFGRNDSGKSNLLRALNLFFNNQTNPDQPFIFERDFNHSRRAEAEDAEGIRKFVYIKVWFTTPANWRASLGNTFWVKKQWSITTQLDPQLTSSIQEQRLQQYLTRFLNKVRFHYIPAIKDRKIFENLQTQIYKVVSAHEEFSGSLTEFANALRHRTIELSSGLLDRLGISSVISTPQDLTDLFRSLDFETRTEIGDSYSLTLQRGDGIQVRHIPPILAFLSDKSSEDYHIWGFEEPENSLELANAIQEAETFRSFGLQNNKQIFLTSHSPAFFSLKNDDVSRYFVSRRDLKLDRLNSKISKIDNSSEVFPGELMGETPHLPVISEYLRESHEKIKRHQLESSQLTQEIAEHNQSIVFVEGESDVIIFTKAWEILMGVAPPFRFESAGGTTKMESLGRDGKVLNHLAPGRAVLALVDNDLEGRALFKSSRLDPGGRWIKHNSNGVHWCRLPFNRDFAILMRKLNINTAYWPGSLENLFSPELRNRAEQAGVLRMTTTPHSELLDSQWYPSITQHLQPRADLEHFFILSVDADTKLQFANWIVDISDAEPEIFEPLRELFERLNQIIVATEE
ncbi:AAA family ATPase [Pseudomonas helvetica]|uniref:ATP-dependent nuclease n=1 Tax=Pseudomonas helvetica TaxID=3136738 RepID=UPI0032649C16